MKQILEKLRMKEDLTFDESKSAFELLMTGKANEEEIYNFLTLLSVLGLILKNKQTGAWKHYMLLVVRSSHFFLSVKTL